MPSWVLLHIFFHASPITVPKQSISSSEKCCHVPHRTKGNLTACIDLILLEFMCNFSLLSVHNLENCAW